jgi:hypothetical protein
MIDHSKFSEELEIVKDKWNIYNKSKPSYRREGLSLFSIDGNASGDIDLDSVQEYNRAFNTTHNEMSFRVPTTYWNHFNSISSLLKPIEHFIGRSHLIRLDEGGFFPPHRDTGNSFRLITFLNSDSYSLNLTLDNKKVDFFSEWIYFMNTRLPHSLFSFKKDAIVLVINLEICEESAEFILNNLQAK